MLAKAWLGLENLTRLIHLKSWDNHRGNKQNEFRNGDWERGKMTNPEAWGREGRLFAHRSSTGGPDCLQ